MSEFKPFGPGSPTGGETSDGGAPGNRDYYPSRESEGYSTGGEASAASSPGSSVPSRPNPNAGGTGIDQSILGSDYDYNQNPTGSSLTEADDASEDDGSYGSRPASTPGTNAGG